MENHPTRLMLIKIYHRETITHTLYLISYKRTFENIIVPTCDHRIIQTNDDSNNLEPISRSHSIFYISMCNTIVRSLWEWVVTKKYLWNYGVCDFHGNSDRSLLNRSLHASLMIMMMIMMMDSMKWFNRFTFSANWCYFLYLVNSKYGKNTVNCYGMLHQNRKYSFFLEIEGF